MNNILKDKSMKRNYSYFKFMASFVVPLAMTAGMVGCSDKENVLNTEEFNKKLEAFNFKTSAPVTLSVDLGLDAAKEVVAVYPTEVDAISANMHTDLLYSAFTDANGRLNSHVVLPTAIKKVWIVSLTKPSLGVITAEIINGQLVVSNNSSNAKSGRRAAQSLQLYNIDNYVSIHEEGKISDQETKQGYSTLSDVSRESMGSFWCVDKWMRTSYPDTEYRFGKTGNENGLISNNKTLADHSGELLSSLQTWVGKNKNTFKQLEADSINQTISPREDFEIEIANGSLTAKYEGSELWVTFLNEVATYQNTFGYYIYKTDEEPDGIADGYLMDRIVIWPSASMYNQAPYTATKEAGTSNTIYNLFAPLRAGDRVQLLFKDPKDPNAPVSKIFPPGYTVGFWFCADAYDPGWNTNGSTCNNLSNTYTSVLNFTQHQYRKDPWRPTKTTNSYFGNSNPLINHGSLKKGTNNIDIPTRFVKFNTKLGGEKFTLYGVEDGTNTSYDDLLFAVSRKDYETITTTDNKRLVVEPFHTISTYAFEDQWPTGGDFDLNDVIIEHDLQQIYTEENHNFIVRDEFRIVSKLNAAGQRNAFYVQLPKGEEGNVNNMMVTVNGKKVNNRWEAATNSIIIFTDQREAIMNGDTSVVVTRDLTGTNYEVGKLSYNPYLIANAFSSEGVSQVGQGRTEIHLPGKEITTLGKHLVVNGTVDTNYYASQFVSDGSMYPFAMELSNYADWKAPDPGVRINETFVKYNSWRVSGGTEDTDWYYNKKGFDNRY